MINCIGNVKDFKNHLRFIQGIIPSGNSIVPNDLINLIKQKFCCSCELSERDTLTYHSIKRFLEETENLKWYDHIYYIMRKCGSPNVCMFNAKEEIKMIESFEELNNVWNDILPFNIKFSFLNYMYITKKLSQKHKIMVPERVFHVSIMFNLEKLIWYDKLWKSACTKLKWKFIPTSI